MSAPLVDITVVALEQAVAAPFASRQLADLGARVIKIERPGVGDFARHYDTRVKGLCSHFVWLNRSKESLTLDLKRPEGKEVLDRLLERADVFLHNLAPGAVERLGYAGETLRARDPALIVCKVSGYGSNGPDRERKAYDLLVQAETGLISITGSPETPSKVGISIADIAAGMYAFAGILCALLARAESGRGQTVEVSLFDALGEWMGYPAYYAGHGGTAPLRSGARHATIAPYGPFATADGSVVLGVQNEREWRRFCDTVLQRPQLAGDARFATNSDRVANVEALQELIGETLGDLETEEALRRLEQARIASARMNGIQEFLEHRQNLARRRWRQIDSPAGRLPALLPPLGLSDVAPRMGPVPALGEHTEPILEELGFAPEAIASLRRAGVV